MAGAKNIHALPLRTAVEMDDLADIVDHAYQYGLRMALWLSAGLVVVVFLLVLRYVKAVPAPSPSVGGDGGGSPHR
jgi:hypothetical protein